MADRNQSERYDPILEVRSAKTPQDIAWAYMLVVNNKQQCSIFLDEVKKKNINEEEWKVIAGWCIKLGLEDLKQKVFNIPPYVPVDI